MHLVTSQERSESPKYQLGLAAYITGLTKVSTLQRSYKTKEKDLQIQVNVDFPCPVIKEVFLVREGGGETLSEEKINALLSGRKGEGGEFLLCLLLRYTFALPTLPLLLWEDQTAFSSLFQLCPPIILIHAF